MFRVFYANLGWFDDATMPTFDAAVELAKSKGFDTIIYNQFGTMVASWSIIGGLKTY